MHQYFFPLTSYKVKETEDMRVLRSLSRRDLQYEIIIYSHQPSFLWITDGHQRVNSMPIDVWRETWIELDYIVLHVAVVVSMGTALPDCAGCRCKVH